MTIVPLNGTGVGGTEAVARAADVLLLFLNNPVLGVRDIARQLAMSKSVVHRILRSLKSRQLLDFDPARRGYCTGPALAALGARALRRLDLRQLALPILRDLQQETGETATLSALVGQTRVFLDQVQSLQEVRMTVELGRSFPLNAGASSKAMLAFAEPALRRQLLDGPLPRITPTTPVDADRVQMELREIVACGTAVSFGERQMGSAAVAAAVLGPEGYAVGAIAVCGPAHRFDRTAIEHHRAVVKPAARQLSLQLGWDDTVAPVHGAATDPAVMSPSR
jgi:DNA-binding IclR family transcriptional regulator